MKKMKSKTDGPVCFCACGSGAWRLYRQPVSLHHAELRQTFGLTSPMVLDFGILTITFALTIKITIASILGIVIALLIYRFL